MSDKTTFYSQDFSKAFVIEISFDGSKLWSKINEYSAREFSQSKIIKQLGPMDVR